MNRARTAVATLPPLLLIAALGLTAACASGPKKTKRSVLPPDPSGPVAGDAHTTDAHMADVAKSAAEQLECPVEETEVRCIGRDGQGDCVAVKATGCGRDLEYKFGADAL
jgi:hypothetical protein